MKTRIRYSKTENNTLYSRESYLASNGKWYQINLNPETLNGGIYEIEQMLPFEEFSATNLHQLKIKAKSKLKEMGVEFEQEKRDKTDEH